MTDQAADKGEQATRKSLVRDLKDLGLAAGNMVFAHSSYRSLGPIDGGAETMVLALLDVLTDSGTLLMPSFNLLPKDKNDPTRNLRAETWKIATSKSTTGYLTDYFRTHPGTVRSDHYSHSVAAVGNRASWFVEGHLSNRGMNSPWDLAPWGATFGADSPFARMYDAGAKILLIGVDYACMTMLHYVETLFWHERRAAKPDANYWYINRPAVGAAYEASCDGVRIAQVGQAKCRLLDMRHFVDNALVLVRQRPEEFFKWRD